MKHPATRAAGPAKSGRNPKVDAFLTRAEDWTEEIKRLRAIALGCGLAEDLKWGKPCYAFQGSNLVILVPLKETCSLLFCKGALLKDPAGLLVQPGEHSQSSRWMRFTSAAEVDAKRSVVTAYIHEAIAAEQAGLKVKYKATADYKMPAELRRRLDEQAALKAAFTALTPGRQRGYIIFVASAKQAKTREARVEKCRPRILAGKGLDD